ncbi:tail fiber assembly protein [Acerihabitans sp.]|uniref:tail fiber assembly protein n=1 Tax=Acerihabitans sp. TaxID=2811394 RepID=UPI0039C873FC
MHLIPRRSALVNEASTRTPLWQAQLLLNSISDAAKALPAGWMGGIRALRAANVPLASNIIWP